MHFEELDALDPRNPIIEIPRIETPTPHKVSVLILVQQYIMAKKAANDASIPYPAQSRRNFCMLLLKLIQYPDMTYNDLYQLLCSPKYKIDPLHLEGYEKVMSDVFTLGIESLFDFAEMENIEKMLAEHLGVSQFSLVGLYIRRVGVILERLSFPEMMALHKNICLYYEKGVRSLSIGPRKLHCGNSVDIHTATNETNDDDDDNTMEESVLDTETVHQDRNPHSKWSPKQAQLFVTQQCNLLEKNELRALPPIEMQTKLNEIIQDNPLNAKAYFLGYMNQLRLRDVFGAMDALHRSFDRSPIHMMGEYEQKGFQYFSVNLAILHASFNHKKEALNALKECIMLAQECGDKRCLDLANSWYCLLNSSRIGPFEKSLPDDPDLSLSLAIEFVVAFGAKCGYLPLDLFELLLKSDELNNKFSSLEHISDSLALRSTLWVLYGRYEMSALYSQLLMNLKKTWAFGDVSNSESVSKVLSNLSLWFNTQGEYQLSAVLLHHARSRFPRHPFAGDWMSSECHIAIQQATYRGRWQEALRWCCQLYLIDKHDGNIQRATVYIAKSYNNTARRILQNLLNDKSLDVLRQIRVLVLMAYNSLSEKIIPAAETIELLMQASVLSESAYMQYEHALIDTIMAQVLLQMGLPQKALQAVRNSMDKIYINGGIYDRAKTDFTFVRCLVAAGKDREQQHKRLMKSLTILKRSVELFRKLEAHAKVLDVFSYIAKTFNLFGLVAERNKYACKFKQYYTENPVSHEYLSMAL